MREMHEILKDYVAKYTGDHRKRRKAISVFLVLAVIVTCGVTWSLKLDGITLAGEAFCGQEEHTHNEKCTEKILICEIEEGVSASTEAPETEVPETSTAETSTPETETERILNCTLTEHTHTEACTEMVLICEMEESDEHTHSEECYEAQSICTNEPEHTHTDECYTVQTIVKETEAPETQPAEKEVKETPATEGHVHTDACYETRQICTKEEHTHAPECYSDKDADLETPSMWEANLPKKTGIWADDIIAIARSQLGYQESTRNFELADDEETRKGYNRYGAWYGNPYGDWNAMFVSFCLNYAGIPQGRVPYASGSYAWSVDLQNRGMYKNPAEYVPVPGDLIFFKMTKEQADHVGIVTYVDEPQKKVRVILGDFENSVQEKEYLLTGSTITGYGKLPENPNPPETESMTEEMTEEMPEKPLEETPEKPPEETEKHVTGGMTGVIIEPTSETAKDLFGKTKFGDDVQVLAGGAEGEPEAQVDEPEQGLRVYKKWLAMDGNPLPYPETPKEPVKVHLYTVPYGVCTITIRQKYTKANSADEGITQIREDIYYVQPGTVLTIKLGASLQYYDTEDPNYILQDLWNSQIQIDVGPITGDIVIPLVLESDKAGLAKAPEPQITPDGVVIQKDVIDSIDIGPDDLEEYEDTDNIWPDQKEWVKHLPQEKWYVVEEEPLVDYLTEYEYYDRKDTAGNVIGEDIYVINKALNVAEGEQPPSDYILPETGGVGTIVYTAGGLLLMLAAALMYIEHKNQRKEEVNSA